jgi:hypothetical protein
LAVATAASAAGFGGYGPNWSRHRTADSIDALLIDETIAVPQRLAAFIKASKQTMPIVGIRLDAAAHAELMRVLDTSHVVIGISSGATLFCLERMAWDHGFRLTGRAERHIDRLGDDADRADVAAFLGAAHPAAAGPSALVRAYRPSRADRVLHSWIMRKPANGQPLQSRRDV